MRLNLFRKPLRNLPSVAIPMRLG